MDQFKNALEKAFNVKQIGAFAPQATYFEEMDCIEYIQKDVMAITERIDELLTLFSDRDGNTIGFKIKGFRNHFEKYLKPYFAFTEENFVDLVSTMEIITNQKAAEFLSENISPADKVERVKHAYNLVRKMAREKELKLYDFPLKLAA